MREAAKLIVVLGVAHLGFDLCFSFLSTLTLWQAHNVMTKYSTRTLVLHITKSIINIAHSSNLFQLFSFTVTFKFVHGTSTTYVPT